MRALFCATVLVLSASPVFSRTSATPSSVTIVYQFNDSTPALVLQGIKDEIQRVLEPSALLLQWRERSDVSGSDSMRNLVVVDFRGQCQKESVASAPNADLPLGRARTINGEVLPFIEIDCGQVQSFLHSSLAGRPGQNTNLNLGRALARVLAHELYHVLAGTMVHSRTGIAQSSLSVADLVSSRFDFSPTDAVLLKSPHERTSEVTIARRGPSYIQ